LYGHLNFFLVPQFVDINVKINKKKSSFSIPDIMDVLAKSFIRAVTEEEQDTKIDLPKGFIWKQVQGNSK
jgi:hypothetical protein